MSDTAILNNIEEQNKRWKEFWENFYKRVYAPVEYAYASYDVNLSKLSAHPAFNAASSVLVGVGCSMAIKAIAGFAVASMGVGALPAVLLTMAIVGVGSFAVHWVRAKEEDRTFKKLLIKSVMSAGFAALGAGAFELLPYNVQEALMNWVGGVFNAVLGGSAEAMELDDSQLVFEQPVLEAKQEFTETDTQPSMDHPLDTLAGQYSGDVARVAGLVETIENPSQTLLDTLDAAENGQGWALNNLAYYMLHEAEGLSNADTRLIFDLYTQAAEAGFDQAQESANYVGDLLTDELNTESAEAFDETDRAHSYEIPVEKVEQRPEAEGQSYSEGRLADVNAAYAETMAAYEQMQMLYEWAVSDGATPEDIYDYNMAVMAWQALNENYTNFLEGNAATCHAYETLEGVVSNCDTNWEVMQQGDRIVFDLGNGAQHVAVWEDNAPMNTNQFSSSFFQQVLAPRMLSPAIS